MGGLQRRYSVGDAIKAVLPEGTNPEETWKQAALFWNDREAPERNKSLDQWRSAPLVPTDLFAAVGHLCKISGLIGFFDPSPYRSDTLDCEFVLTQEHRKLADDAANIWRQQKHAMFVPTQVSALWESLLEAEVWDASINSSIYMNAKEGPPEWWRTALLLVMIADMACDRLLRDPLIRPNDGVDQPNPFESWIKMLYVTTLDREHATGETHERPPPSLCVMADSNVVCVLPKVRVAPVGATMRNVTRNLSLLPGRSEVRCFWETPIRVAPAETNASLDILLIPEPRKIKSTDFSDNGHNKDSDRGLHYWMRDWSTFEINQSWIEDGDTQDEFINDCEKLLAKAQSESRGINGVILPEYALNDKVFQLLCERLKRKEEKLEFVISGSSDNCDKETGNHVMTRVWYATDEKETASQDGSASDVEYDSASQDYATLTQSRRKHHRWRMDRGQVENYALSSALNPKIKNWWEDTPLTRRQIQFQRFRKKSVFAVLICEELARSEPCHEILRSVAPNLIFALLLDGPQIEKRWPAQYASNLADDPGSAVLTFTSYGLIDRTNKQGRFDPNHSIALWKDDTGKIVEIKMPPGEKMRGVLLSLWSDNVVDRTITGKQSRVLSWRYANHMPISLNE